MSKDKIRVLQGRKIEVDTSRFKDELATRIGWGPLKKGGTNICTFHLVGGVFSMVGVWLLISETVPKTFDKVSGFFYVGRKQPSPRGASGGKKKAVSVPLSDIHAIQIVPEYIHSSRSHRSRTSSYFSYELNLVLKDGKRLHVIDHGNCEMIQKDGDKLASFLQVPCWDASYEASLVQQSH